MKNINKKKNHNFAIAFFVPIKFILYYFYYYLLFLCLCKSSLPIILCIFLLNFENIIFNLFPNIFRFVFIDFFYQFIFFSFLFLFFPVLFTFFSHFLIYLFFNSFSFFRFGFLFIFSFKKINAQELNSILLVSHAPFFLRISFQFRHSLASNKRICYHKIIWELK